MAISRVKVWAAGEVLTASDLNAEFNNLISNGQDIGSPRTKAFDLNGQQLTIDADADSYLIEDSDDVIKMGLQGVDLFYFDGDVTSPVNGLTFTASATATDVSIDATGTDTNIDIALNPKGTGSVVLGGDLDLNSNNIDFPTTADISDCLDEDDMSSDSATALATQQSIKAYVDGVIESGTRMLFQQSSAPTGWTKDTTANLDNTALRIVTGSVGSRTNQSSFTTVFGLTATDAHTLTTSQIPSHSHGVSDSGHRHGTDDQTQNRFLLVDGGVNTARDVKQGGATDMSAINGVSINFDTTSTSGTASATTGISINNAGGGGSHSHNIDTRVNYHDFIVGTKD